MHDASRVAGFIFDTCKQHLIGVSDRYSSVRNTLIGCTFLVAVLSKTLFVIYHVVEGGVVRTESHIVDVGGLHREEVLPVAVPHPPAEDEPT